MFATIRFVINETEPSRSRRERPAKPALTRAGIVSAAVRVMRSEGLERVTMRRLAQELDTGPASLYVYVRNASELRVAVLDELLSGVDLGAVTADGDCWERLNTVLGSYLSVLLEYPELAWSALRTHSSGPHYLALVEAVLALLHEAGVDDRTAAWAVDLLLQVATATGAEQVSRRENPGRRSEWDALEDAVAHADAGRYPRIHALGTELMSGTGEGRIDWGLTVLKNGILATRRTQSSGRGTEAHATSQQLEE